MTFTEEIESPVSAVRMFKAALFDFHVFFPHITRHVSGAELLEGEGKVGSVRQFNFTGMPVNYLKERLDFIDHEKLECKTTTIEGGHLNTILESESFHIKIEPTSTGGCICKIVTDAKFKPGVNVRDEEAKAKEHLVKFFKAAEAYLLANPDA